MSAAAKPTFEESCHRFRKFLKDSGWPPELVWLRPDDVLLTGRRFLYIKSSSSSDNLPHYHNQFERGMDEQLGVLMKGLCKSKDKTFCFVWIPADPDESMRHMMPKGADALKMSIPSGLSAWPVQEIHSRLCWLYLCWKYRSKQDFKDQLFY